MKRLSLMAACAAVLAGCGSTGSAAPGRQVTPVYSKETGRLEELTSDRDGDGKVDTRAFMDGVRVQRIEIDRDRDGRPDRWEFYSANSPAGTAQIERAEESEGPNARIVRREYYDAGLISRVEEDTDGDNRVDKWEHYTRGLLNRVELDFDGRGKPTQRLVYGLGGNVERVESDPDGDGAFVPVKTESRPAATQ
jgi:hypothetical protein